MRYKYCFEPWNRADHPPMAPLPTSVAAACQLFKAFKLPVEIGGYHPPKEDIDVAVEVAKMFRELMEFVPMSGGRPNELDFTMRDAGGTFYLTIGAHQIVRYCFWGNPKVKDKKYNGLFSH